MILNNKTYKQLLSTENLTEAIISASQNKKDRKEVQKSLDDIQGTINRIRKYIKHFENITTTYNKIYDVNSCKTRNIYSPTFDEQIVHHALVQVLMPIFKTNLYPHTYASIPGRGPHKGKETIEKWIDTNNGKRVKFYCKFDIRKFFDNIDHEILLEKLSEYIHDEKIMKLIAKLLTVKEDGVGLPIGFYTSHWFANFFLKDFDHQIVGVLGYKCYIRYMDDIVIFYTKKRKFNNYDLPYINKMLNELKLEMKEEPILNRFSYIDKHTKELRGKDLDFMGFRFYRTHTEIRKRNLHKLLKTVKDINEKGYKLHLCRRMMSYNGYLVHTSSYQLHQDRIRENCNMGLVKKTISDDSKSKAKQAKEKLNEHDVNTKDNINNDIA